MENTMSTEFDQPIIITPSDVESILCVKRNARLMSINPFLNMDIDSWKNLSIMCISAIAFAISAFYYSFTSPASIVLSALLCGGLTVTAFMWMCFTINDATNRSDIIKASIPLLCTIVSGIGLYGSYRLNMHIKSLNIEETGSNAIAGTIVFISVIAFVWSTILLFVNAHQLAHSREFRIDSSSHPPKFMTWVLDGKWNAPTYVIDVYNAFFERHNTNSNYAQCVAYHIDSDKAYVSKDIVYCVMLSNQLYLIAVIQKPTTEKKQSGESSPIKPLTPSELDAITKLMKARATRSLDA